MLSSEFLNGHKIVNIGLLKRFRLLSLVSSILNPVSNGAVTQRANTNTYRTSDFMMAIAQNDHPDTYGDDYESGKFIGVTLGSSTLFLTIS